MDFGITWILILSSLCMGLAGVCIFIYAIKRDLFKDIEDIKYQVFWSELEESPVEPEEHGRDKEGHEQERSGGSGGASPKVPT